MNLSTSCHTLGVMVLWYTSVMQDFLLSPVSAKLSTLPPVNPETPLWTRRVARCPNFVSRMRHLEGSWGSEEGATSLTAVIEHKP